MTTVTIHGELAQVLGRNVWQFEVETPAEIFRALEANTGKLLAHMFANQTSEYHLVIDDDGIRAEAELGAVQQMKNVHLLPVLAGSSSKGTGGLLAIIGLVIIAAVVIIATYGAATPVGTALVSGGALFGGGTLTTLGAFAVTLGLTLTLTGISQMLIKGPQNDNTERPENKPSYLFNGAVNSYRQGNPVPVGFGRLRVGSQIISVGMRSVDLLDPVK